MRLPLITPRSGRFLIGLFLCIKLALLVWNAYAFDGRPYDVGHHSDRALFGGLRSGKMAYNPPPYYFPALLVKRPPQVPLVERSSETIGEDEEAVQSRKERTTPASRVERRFRNHLIEVLRYSNIFWVGLFYVGWIGYAFPRLLRSFQGWFLASLLLLAMPGYQKLGVMTHPDNMFAGCASLAICGWLFLRERWQRSQRTPPVEADAPASPGPPAPAAPGFGLPHLVGFAVAVGLTALTRPFAAVPVAVLSVVATVYVMRLSAGRWKAFLPRLVLVGAIIGAMSTSWYIYRWKHSGEVTNAYRTGYIAKFEKRRADFDFVKYYTTFNLADLIVDPSRKMGDGGESVYADTPLANSFFTLLYSEIWGDQWLYFSGPKLKDFKVWPKRLILTCALLVPPIIAGLGGMFLWDMLRRAREQLRKTKDLGLVRRFRELASLLERELVLLAIAGLGAALFIYWQAGPALLPGKNSTVKFIYIATLFPPLLALVFSRRLRPITFNVLSGYFLLLYIAAFPFAMYWPQ